MDFAKFLNFIYLNCNLKQNEHDSYRIVCWARQTKIHRAFNINDFQGMKQWCDSELKQNRDVYYCVTIQDNSINDNLGKYRSIEASVAIFGIWCDLDCKDDSGAHKSGNLPTREEALAFLENFPLRPTLVIDTGHGFHAYWLLNEAFFFITKDDRLKAEDLVENFQAKIRSIMKTKGWDLDATHDLSRFLRIPGTKNFKSSIALDVTIEQQNPNARYTWDELAAHTEKQERTSVKKKKQTDTPKRPSKPGIKSNGSEATKRCLFLTYSKVEASTLSEPLWWAMICVLAHSADGRNLIHDMSKSYPGYSEEETDSKINAAIELNAPMTCAKISELTGNKHCANCAYQNKVATPLQLGSKAWGDGKDPIILNNDLDDEMKASLAVIHKSSEIYQRGGRLVRIIEDTATKQPGQSAPLVIQPLNSAALKGLLAEMIRYLRENKQGEVYPVYPPDPMISGILEKGYYPNIRHLQGITQVPILTANGAILQKPGYDPESEMLYKPLTEFPPIPEKPTDGEIATAIAIIMEVLEDFPIVNEGGKAVFLASILTHLSRLAYLGPSPMTLISANTPGVGKTKIADAISLITTGMSLPRSTQTKSDEEERKRITATLMKGNRFYLIDNVGSRLGGPILDALLTSEIWQDRVLGGNNEISLRNHLQVIATGNNLELQGDTLRRCLQISLESRVEHPEAREDFRHPNLEEWILENQPRLLVAALTILRGYFAAGLPPQKLISLGSYEKWSRIVQAAVKWSIDIDPGLARPEAGEGFDLHAQILDLLITGFKEIAKQEELLTCRQIMERVGKGLAGQAVLDALEMAFPGKPPTATAFGNLLRRFNNRLHHGHRFVHDANKTAAGHRWKLIYPAPTLTN